MSKARPAGSTGPTQRVGRAGEQSARSSLEEAGYRILAENYRCPFGEIDLIAEDRNVLVFVEVKCRTASAYGLPRDAVTAAKRRKLARAASHYMMEHVEDDRAYRVDIVEVCLVHGRVAGVRLLPGAFSLDGELERLS